MSVTGNASPDFGEETWTCQPRVRRRVPLLGHGVFDGGVCLSSLHPTAGAGRPLGLSIAGEETTVFNVSFLKLRREIETKIFRPRTSPSSWIGLV